MPYYKLDGSRRLWSQEAPREARHVPEQIVKAMRTRYTTRRARVQRCSTVELVKYVRGQQMNLSL